MFNFILLDTSVIIPSQHFNTPWYAWPITGAVIASVMTFVGAIVITWATFRYQRHLKLMDAVEKVRYHLFKFEMAISLAAVSIHDAGKRFEKIGWDNFADILNELGVSTEILGIYGDSRMARSCNELYEEVKNLYTDVHNAVVNSEVYRDGAKQIPVQRFHNDKKVDAQMFLSAVSSGEHSILISEKWITVKSLAKMDLKRSLIYYYA